MPSQSLMSDLVYFLPPHILLLYLLQFPHFVFWRRKWQPAPVFLPGKPHGQRSLRWVTVHGVPEGWTWLTNWPRTFSPPSARCKDLHANWLPVKSSQKNDCSFRYTDGCLIPAPKVSSMRRHPFLLFSEGNEKLSGRLRGKGNWWTEGWRLLLYNGNRRLQKWSDLCIRSVLWGSLRTNTMLYIR